MGHTPEWHVAYFIIKCPTSVAIRARKPSQIADLLLPIFSPAGWTHWTLSQCSPILAARCGRQHCCGPYHCRLQHCCRARACVLASDPWIFFGLSWLQFSKGRLQDRPLERELGMAGLDFRLVALIALVVYTLPGLVLVVRCKACPRPRALPQCTPSRSKNDDGLGGFPARLVSTYKNLNVNFRLCLCARLPGSWAFYNCSPGGPARAFGRLKGHRCPAAADTRRHSRWNTRGRRRVLLGSRLRTEPDPRSCSQRRSERSG